MTDDTPVAPPETPPELPPTPPPAEPVLETPATPPPSPEASEGQGAPEPTPVETSVPPVVETPPPPPQSVEPSSSPRSILAKGLEAIRFRKKAKLEKIVALAANKRSVTNDDVQKHLRISDATATRYLTQLVGEGRLRRIGKDGSTHYEPAN